MIDWAQAILNEDSEPGAAEIADRLAAAYAQSPGENTVRDWIAKHWIVRDPLDAPWTFAEAPEDADLILPVVRAVVEDVARLGGLRRRRITRREATWVVHIRRAAPDLEDLWTIFYLAALMESDPDAVEMFLTYTPWRDGGMALLPPLAAAVKAGTVPFATAERLGYGPEVLIFNDPDNPRNRRSDTEGANS